MDIDLTTLTDERLDALRVDVLVEKERRSNLEHIPEQVSDLVKTYRAGGGDEDALIQAINNTPDPEPAPE